MLRLAPPPQPDDVLASLSRAALELFGPERLDALQGNLRQLAGWLSLVGSVSLDLADESPDRSGFEPDSEPAR